MHERIDGTFFLKRKLQGWMYKIFWIPMNITHTCKLRPSFNESTATK